ncbi:hypothetical protein FACS1894190_14470 [Spirochaetia bacterium]|nr:hypothetical protein FACS1894190_14470 [Spirochaetia bacterium]
MLNLKKILIADNDQLNVEFFELMLSKLGFQVDMAADGNTAWEKITHDKPDIILLETVLPKISGWKILERIRKDPKLETLPVLLLSKIDDPKELVEGFELGADDYIIKPFNFSVVLARIRAALRNRVLITEITAREARLELAEKLSAEMKANISNLQTSVKMVDNAIKNLKKESSGEISTKDLLKIIEEKTGAVKTVVFSLEQHIAKMDKEWKDLKKNEIGLTILEKPIRDTVSY